MHILKKLFVFVLIFNLIIIVVTQFFLKNDETKMLFSKIYEIESQYVYSEKSIDEGYIILKTNTPSDKLFVLQNGEKITVLNKKENKINIMDNSVIEIDGRECDCNVLVEIVEHSTKINGYYENSIEINSDIVILGRFFIN